MLGPVQLFPRLTVAGGCTRGVVHVHLRFPPVKVPRVFSSRMTNWKSARFRGKAAPLSAPLQRGLRFFQPPLPANPSAFLAETLASKARRAVGFAMLNNNDTNELAPAYHTGSLECPRVPCVQWNNRLRAFWLEPDSIFGSLGLTMLMAVHLGWAFHSACPSDRVDARSRGNRLTEVSSPGRWKDVVSAASDPAVASHASADRLLRTEPQVRLTTLCSYRTIIVIPSLFRTDALPLRINRRFSGYPPVNTNSRVAKR